MNEKKNSRCNGCPYKRQECERIDKNRPGSYHGKDDTLCYCCLNAVPGIRENGAPRGCSWSRSFIPVAGWIADKETSETGRETYRVFVCPEFKRGIV